jgi:hypothetical protein
MNSPGHPWALVIFANRESLHQLRQTLTAALASASSCSVIHVLVNGNPALANAMVAELTQQQAHSKLALDGPAVMLWSIPLADKANAWNQYIHELWAGEEIVFFIDGYIKLNADAVELLGTAVAANPQALGGTGVPTMGRSAKALRENMIVNTGYHGNFCCIKGDTIHQMRDKLIRLPLGLYRTDSLMGAILCYALDPGCHIWEDYRIHVHPTASWQIDPAKWWRLKDLNAYAKRHFRQARGKLENAAFADHLVNRMSSPAALPATAREMVIEWVGRCRSDATALMRANLSIRWAIREFQTVSLPTMEQTMPRMVWQRHVCGEPPSDGLSTTQSGHVSRL